MSIPPAATCDVAVAAENASFWLPEAQLGILADSAALRLPKRLPQAVATELLMTGRRMDAEAAQRWGLVNRVVPGDELMTAARALAEDVSASAPLSLATLKEVFAANETKSIEEGYALYKSGTLAIYEQMLKSEDAIEGPQAFAEKREPQWKGK